MNLTLLSEMNLRFLLARVIGTALALLLVVGNAASQTREIKTASFRGKLYEERVSAKRGTAVLLIGGSEGQLLMADAIAPRIAALGYPVFGIDYHGGFADRTRPLANVPIEQFVAAVEWLRRDQGAKRVVIIGESRGSEAALLTTLQSNAVSAVVGVVPSIYVWSAVGSDDPAGPSAWSISGKPLTYVLPFKDANPDANTFSKSITADANIERATIAIEKLRVPTLLLAGDDDWVWPAGEFAQAAKARLARLNPRTPVQVVVFQNAGHRLLGVGSSSPTETYAWDGGSFTARYGGTEPGNARARAQVWKQIVLLLQKVEVGQ
jgi:uncharacterized protein